MNRLYALWKKICQLSNLSPSFILMKMNDRPVLWYRYIGLFQLGEKLCLAHESKQIPTFFKFVSINDWRSYTFSIQNSKLEEYRILFRSNERFFHVLHSCPDDALVDLQPVTLTVAKHKRNLENTCERYWSFREVGLLKMHRLLRLQWLPDN